MAGKDLHGLWYNPRFGTVFELIDKKLHTLACRSSSSCRTSDPIAQDTYQQSVIDDGIGTGIIACGSVFREDEFGRLELQHC